MANTNDLKKIIEPALIEGFWKLKGAKAIEPSAEMRKVLLGMTFDGTGIHDDQGILHVCEVTVSGFLGHRGRNFHIGATKKLADTFARFSIVLHKTVRDRLLQVASNEYALKLTGIECHLVVPDGSRFIRALGYRTKLLEMGVMGLVQVKLSEEKCSLMEGVLRSAREEMTQ